jgi:16S rRNA G527 N7-methylase RsmG
VEHVHGAAEFSGTFDYVTVRAVAQVGTLVSMSAPLLRPYGQMLFLKGKNYHNEMNSVATFQGYRLVKDYPLAECPLFSSPQDGHLLVMAKRHASKRHFA